MPQLVAVRFRNIGTQHARAADLTLPCTDGLDPAHAVVWLRNGGGKSSLLAMLLATLAPRQAAFLKRSTGSGEKAAIADYLTPQELGVVACEWQLDGRPGDTVTRAITGVAYTLHEGTDRTPDRLFFAARCVDGSPLSSVADLPEHDPSAPGRRLTAARLREWFVGLRAQVPAAEVQLTSTLTEWEDVLRGLRLDPHLFYMQAKMNEDEAGADRLFARATKDEEFTGFILETLFDGGDPTADLPQFKATVEANRVALRRLHTELRPEAAILDTLVPHLQTLADVLSADAAARTTLQQAIRPALHWQAALPAVIHRLETALATSAAELDELEKTRDAAFQVRRVMTKRAAHLRLRASTAQERVRVRAHAEATAAKSTAHHTIQCWDVAEAWQDHRAATQSLADAQATLEAAQEGAEPLRRRRDEAAGRAVAVCVQALAAANEAVNLASQRDTAARERRDAAVDERGKAESALATRKREHRDLVTLETRATTDRTRLAERGAWPIGLPLALAAREHSKVLERLDEDRETIREARQQRRAEATAEAPLRAEVEQDATTATAALQLVADWRRRADALTSALQTREDWAWVDGGAGDPTTWTGSTVATLRRLASEARRQNGYVERIHGTALEAVDALRRGEPIPVPAAVISAVATLAAERVTATPAWTALSSAGATLAQAELALTVWPALAHALIVDDADWGPAEHALRHSDILPARALLTPLWAVPMSVWAKLLAQVTSATAAPRLTSGEVAPAPLGRAIWGARLPGQDTEGALTRLDHDLAAVEREQSALYARATACDALAGTLEHWLEEAGPEISAAMIARETTARHQADDAGQRRRHLQDRAAARDEAEQSDDERQRLLESRARDARDHAEACRAFEREFGPSLEDIADRIAASTLRVGEASELHQFCLREVADADQAMAQLGERLAEQRDERARLTHLRNTLPAAEVTTLPTTVAADLRPEDAVEQYQRAHEQYLREATPTSLTALVDEAATLEQRRRAALDEACRRRQVTSDAVAAAVATLTPGQTVGMMQIVARDVYATAMAEFDRASTELGDARGELLKAEADAKQAGEITEEELGDVPPDPSSARSLAAVYDGFASEASSKASVASAALQRIEAARRELEQQHARVTAQQARMGDLARRVEDLGIDRGLVRHADEPVGDVDPDRIEKDLLDATEAVTNFHAGQRQREAQQKTALKALRDRLADPAVDALSELAAPRRFKGMADDDIALSAAVQLEEVARRTRVIRDAIAHIETSRTNVVTVAITLSERALRQVRAFCKHTTLPAGLGRLSGTPLLRARVEELESTVVVTAIGDRIERWCSSDDSVPAATTMLAELVRARCHRLRFTIVRPDITRADEHEPLQKLMSYSGGEKLTVTLVLYCALARTRAELRSDDPKVRATSLLILDNPFGKASRGSFLDVQTRLASAMGIQFLFWTGVNDVEALSRIPTLIRLRNDSWDRRTQRSIITRDTTTLEIVPSGHLTIAGDLPFGLGVETITTPGYATDVPNDAAGTQTDTASGAP